MANLGRATAPGRRKDVAPIDPDESPRPSTLHTHGPHTPIQRPPFAPGGNFTPQPVTFNRAPQVIWGGQTAGRRDWTGAAAVPQPPRHPMPPQSYYEGTMTTGSSGQPYPNAPTIKGGRRMYTFRDRMAAARVVQYAYRYYRKERTERVRREAMATVIDGFSSEAIHAVVDDYLTDDITAFVVNYLHSREYQLETQCASILMELLLDDLYEMTAEVMRDTANQIVSAKGVSLQRDALVELEKWCYGMYREGRPFRLHLQTQMMPVRPLIDMKIAADGAVEAVVQMLVVQLTRQVVKELASQQANSRIHEQLVDVAIDEYLISVLDPVLMAILEEDALPYITETLEMEIVTDMLTQMVEVEYDVYVDAAEEGEFQVMLSRTVEKAQESLLLRAVCEEFVKVVDDGGFGILRRHMSDAVMHLVLCSASTKVHTSLLQSSHKIQSYPPQVHKAMADLYDATLLSVLCDEYGKVCMTGVGMARRKSQFGL